MKNRKNFRLWAAVAGIPVIAVLVFVTWGLRLAAQPQPFSGFGMGSVLGGSLWADGLPFPGLSGDFTGAVLETEAELNAAADPVQNIRDVMEKSGGAFDPYIGALTRLWNIDGKDGDEPRVPTQAEIDAALALREHDPGAYGKGAACDAALRMLDSMDVRGAVFDLGGNILTCGQKPFWQPFTIALRDPMGGANDVIGVFTLKGTHFISTSGSYEKYFELDGVRYHHIFDPRTGYPAETDGLCSVTVITTDAQGNAAGALGDALSTACFVLGYEEACALLDDFGCDALFVYEDGTVRAHGDARDCFELAGGTYHWE